ncbi:MAG: hypothetical protein Kow0031_37050 [Anaerolineae bacterium]
MTEKHVLIVDDDCNQLKILKKIVETICPNCRVWIAHNGYAALNIISTRTADTPFHLILTDYEMPHMNGLEFALAVRSLWPAVTIALMSGSGKEQMLANLTQQHNLNAYLKKPFGINRLEHLLNKTVTTP